MPNLLKQQFTLKLFWSYWCLTSLIYSLVGIAYTPDSKCSYKAMLANAGAETLCFLWPATSIRSDQNTVKKPQPLLIHQDGVPGYV